jgi:hypothetical protein
MREAAQGELVTELPFKQLNRQIDWQTKSLGIRCVSSTYMVTIHTEYSQNTCSRPVVWADKVFLVFLDAFCLFLAFIITIARKIIRIH